MPSSNHQDMKSKYKQISRNVITFQSGDDLESLIMAKLGMSNKAIKAKTNLSDNQISYRLAKAKSVEEAECGYRIAFRDGVSPLATRMMRDLRSVALADIKANVSTQIVKLTPETVRLKIEHLTPKVQGQQH